MDAVVIAGGRPRPDEPLYALTQGGYKAMLDVAGKPMVQRVLDALGGAQKIGRVVVVGLPPGVGLTCAKPLTCLPDQGDLFGNLQVGVAEVRRAAPETQHVLGVSSDIPLVTAEMVDWMVTTVAASDADLVYNVITRATMEARFPGSHRTYLKLKGVDVTGGDLNALRAAVVGDHNPLWDRLIAARKSPLKQAALVGYDTLLLLLLRRLDLEGVARQVSGRLGLKGRAIECPFAEIGMDVDKPFQLEIVRGEISRRRPDA